MNLFRTLAALLSAELTATIVIKKTAGGKMTVVTNFTTGNGGVCDTLAPFTLRGTPEELDEGFLDAIQAPVETVSGLVSNLAAFQKSAQQAEKNAKSTATKPAPASKDDTARKLEEEKKRREAEAKARKENFDKAMSEAKAANAKGNYFTAEALLNLAAEFTDDKKVKAEIARQIKTVITPGKEGFLCMDDKDAAEAAVKAFMSATVKPQTGSAPAVETSGNESDPNSAAAGEPEDETENDNE